MYEIYAIKSHHLTLACIYFNTATKEPDNKTTDHKRTLIKKFKEAAGRTTTRSGDGIHVTDGKERRGREAEWSWSIGSSGTWDARSRVTEW
jgi:hypothetical protein